MAAIDVDVVAMITLMIALLGWGVTYYHQRRIINKQAKAHKDLASLNFEYESALRQRELSLDVLPDLRHKMMTAYRAVSAVGRRKIQLPDFEALNGSHLTDWIERLDFTDSQKEELLRSQDKAKYFLETQFRQDEIKAHNTLVEFHNYLLEKKESIDPELFLEFGKIEYLFNNTLNGVTTGRRSGDALYEFRVEEDLAEKAPELMENIEEMIRAKANKNSLRNHDRMVVSENITSERADLVE